MQNVQVQPPTIYPPSEAEIKLIAAVQYFVFIKSFMTKQLRAFLNSASHKMSLCIIIFLAV